MNEEEEAKEESEGVFRYCNKIGLNQFKRGEELNIDQIEDLTCLVV